MSVSFCVTHKRYLIFCNDIIIDKIIAYNCGGINKTKPILIFIVGHLGFLITVNYILISFN